MTRSSSGVTSILSVFTLQTLMTDFPQLKHAEVPLFGLFGGEFALSWPLPEDLGCLGLRGRQRFPAPSLLTEVKSSCENAASFSAALRLRAFFSASSKLCSSVRSFF